MPTRVLGLVLVEDRQLRDVARGLGGLARHAADRRRVGPQRLDALLGLAQARGGDHLHRPRDLLDVLDRGDAALDVLLAPCASRRGSPHPRAPWRTPPRRCRRRCRRSSSLSDLLLGGVGVALVLRLALLVEVVAEVARRTPRSPRRAPSASRRTSRRRRSSPACSEASECRRSTRLAVELGDAVGVDAVQVAVGRGVEHRDLVLDRHRLALALVERLHEPLAAGQRALRVRVEVGAELRERLEVAVLGELDLELAGHLLHRRDLRVAAHARHRDADVDGRAHAGVEEVVPTLMAGRTPELKRFGSRKIWPSVIEMTLVGM